MVEVEERIAVPVSNALDMKAVPVVEADRERPEPEVLLEPGVGAPHHSLPECDVLGKEILVVLHAQAVELGPVRRLLARLEEDHLQPVSEPLREPCRQTTPEEELRGQRIGKDEPDPPHQKKSWSPVMTRQRSKS